MKPYVRTYINALGLDSSEPIYSELSRDVANDIHHIEAKGMGGTSNPERNSIFNLMALTRDEHEKYGDRKQYKRFLKMKHMEFLMKKGVRILGVYQQVNFVKGKIEFIL